MAHGPKLLRLPDSGHLLVAADLHGNLRDFLAIAALFEQLGKNGYLLFLGDLLHGPYLPLEQWSSAVPKTPLRGRPYQDQSPGILLALCELSARFPGRIFTLLGNHEHAHAGGPRTHLFARDEVAALEQRLGIEASLWLDSFCKGLPLWALAPCGLLFSHAAPAADPTNLELADLEAIDYRRYVSPPQLEPHRAGPDGANGRSSEAAARLLGQILWAQALSPPQAQTLLGRVGAQLAIYGHAVIEVGYQTIGEQQLILSSSFGMEDAQKRVLHIDLSARYRSVADLRPGAEILPLYPFSP